MVPYESNNSERRLNTRILQVSVWRGHDSGAYQHFEVPTQDNQTVLDVVTHIQRELDPGLAYRFACRVGVCGSCAMTVNGVARWTCRTHVSRVAGNGVIRIGPLRNLPVIRDLVVDMTAFFEKWQKVRGRFTGKEQDARGLERIEPGSEERREANAAIECISCGVCYSACDVVSANRDYLGPAALNRAWAAFNDVRDADRPGILKAASSEGGCLNCHTHQSCALRCPVGLNPTRSIAGLKRRSVEAYLKGDASS